MALIIFILGLFLCFWGSRLAKPSVQITALIAGAVIGHFLGGQFDKPAVLWGLTFVGAVSFFSLATLAFSAGVFIVGALAGAAVYRGFEISATAGQWIEAPAWGIVAAAAAGGILAGWLQKRVLAILTAVIGGYLVVESGPNVLAGNFSGWGAQPGWPGPLFKDFFWFIMTFSGLMAQRSGLSRKEKE